MDEYRPVYRLDWYVDGILLPLSTGLLLAGYSVYYDVPDSRAADIEALDIQDIPWFDRFAAELWSPAADALSHVSLGLSIAAPLSLFFMPAGQQETAAVAVMLYESLALTIGINILCKGLIERYRPLAYNDAVSMDIRLDADARKAFFSGHSALSWVSTTFFAKVYTDMHPESLWVRPVWIGALGLSTLTAGLRVAAGQHYLSDAAIGAGVGFLIGWLVPELHKQKDARIAFMMGEEPDSFIVSYHRRF